MRKIREYADWELWIDETSDTAGICRAGEKPDMNEYSIPYLAKEWRRHSGEDVELDASDLVD